MKKQISDSVRCGILLALSGGCMDAYSYLFRGHVFANAQTGNMLLFGVNLAEGNYLTAQKYLWPIMAFTLGIIISDVIDHRKKNIKIHWRQLSVFIEIIVLILVAFIPESLNSLANALTSLACGIQVESFRKIHGNVIATTMCIGNLRSGTFYLDRFIEKHDVDDLFKALLYYGVILTFIIGAVIESILIKVFGIYAILLSPLLLTVTLLIMFYGTEDPRDLIKTAEE